MTYSEKLRDPRWQKKRLQVLEKFGFKCYMCEDQETELHVHHKYYERGKEPWQYPLYNFQVLCKHCHALAGWIKKDNTYRLANVSKVTTKGNDVYLFAAAALLGDTSGCYSCICCRFMGDDIFIYLIMDGQTVSNINDIINPVF